MTDRAVLDVQARRLHIVVAEREMSLDEFARARGASVPVETLALINQLEPGARLERGQAYKVVTGGPPAR